MKFTVHYSRKVKAGLAYEMLEIGLVYQSDDSVAPPRDVFERVRSMVNSWIEEERDRLLKTSVKRPETEREGDVHD